MRTQNHQSCLIIHSSFSFLICSAIFFPSLHFSTDTDYAAFYSQRRGRIHIWAWQQVRYTRITDHCVCLSVRLCGFRMLQTSTALSDVIKLRFHTLTMLLCVCERNKNPPACVQTSGNTLHLSPPKIHVLKFRVSPKTLRCFECIVKTLPWLL